MVLDFVVEIILVIFWCIIFKLYLSRLILALMREFRIWLGKLLPVEESANLCLIPGEAEIFVAISELGINKALGPDGMIGLFYKSYWPIVKTSVISSIQSFFRGGYMLKEFNHTNIALIPKVVNPLMVHHFYPISLTNFNYKIISKLLSNRFKPLLQKLFPQLSQPF
jgi:hypothetical protein